MAIKKPEKTAEELQQELVDAASCTVNSYEEYLMDKIGWRDLASIMTNLRKKIQAVDSTKLPPE